MRARRDVIIRLRLFRRLQGFLSLVVAAHRHFEQAQSNRTSIRVTFHPVPRRCVHKTRNEETAFEVAALATDRQTTPDTRRAHTRSYLAPESHPLIAMTTKPLLLAYLTAALTWTAGKCAPPIASPPREIVTAFFRFILFFPQSNFSSHDADGSY